MKRKRSGHVVIMASLCLIILILDAKTALAGAQSGIDLCIKNIIPALLPFCLLSKIINSALLGRNLAVLQPIGRLTGMPKGSESILILSFISGYPLGAQCVGDAYENGSITLTDATRMLAFCNNAGPAFLFGVISCLFPNVLPLWTLYLTHILSAIIAGIIIPGKSKNTCEIKLQKGLSLSQTITASAKTICLISIWVVVFRIILQFIEAWFAKLSGPIGQAVISGILELANGCVSLIHVECLGLRYILCAVFLSFGGCCIFLQTAAVTKQVPLSKYFPGKILQTAISGFTAALTQYILFNGNDIFQAEIILLLCLITGIFSTIILCKSKKVVAIA